MKKRLGILVFITLVFITNAFAESVWKKTEKWTIRLHEEVPSCTASTEYPVVMTSLVFSSDGNTTNLVVTGNKLKDGPYKYPFRTSDGKTFNANAYLNHGSAILLDLSKDMVLSFMNSTWVEFPGFKLELIGTEKAFNHLAQCATVAKKLKSSKSGDLQKLM